MKHDRLQGDVLGAAARFPRLYAAASLKHGIVLMLAPPRSPFSAALCRGLIEANGERPSRPPCGARFPRLYAAASLKHDAGPARRPPRCGRFPRLYAAASLKRYAASGRGGTGGGWFSAALCRGLIEAWSRPPARAGRAGSFPRLYAAASLKRDRVGLLDVGGAGFPRLYAAASLKRAAAPGACAPPRAFSAALCRGLIEAKTP